MEKLRLVIYLLLVVLVMVPTMNVMASATHNLDNQNHQASINGGGDDDDDIGDDPVPPQIITVIDVIYEILNTLGL